MNQLKLVLDHLTGTKQYSFGRERASFVKIGVEKWTAILEKVCCFHLTGRTYENKNFQQKILF